MSKYRIFVGSYTGSRGGNPGGKGLYVFDMDSSDCKLVQTHICTDCVDPSYLIVKGDRLYAGEESRENGAVAALSINEDGSLQFRSRTRLSAGGVCHLALWPDGDMISASHYGTGALSTIAIDKNGDMGDLINTVYHNGSGKDARRQAAPHVHSSWVTPDGNNLLVCDLGTDTVSVYAKNEKSGHVVPDSKKTVHVPDGRGPRHIAFSPDGRHLALITEMGGTIIVYSYGENGIGSQLCEVSILPENYTELNTSAHVQYSPDGRFLFASNRGHDSIAVFEVDENGMPYNRKFYPCYGSGPRNFSLTPDGKYIVIANQQSGNVVLCGIEKETGKISEPLSEVSVPLAVCAVSIIL